MKGQNQFHNSFLTLWTTVAFQLITNGNLVTLSLAAASVERQLLRFLPTEKTTSLDCSPLLTSDVANLI